MTTDRTPVTAEEMGVLNLLGSAWDTFVKIPNRGEAETQEFMNGIHRLQDLVGARSTWRILDRRIPSHPSEMEESSG